MYVVQFFSLHRVDAEVVVKVGDFGLARWTENEYYLINTLERPLPAKWMAPEALDPTNRKFSTLSDVVSLFYLLIMQIKLYNSNALLYMT